jgi:hypothetical protein
MPLITCGKLPRSERAAPTFALCRESGLPRIGHIVAGGDLGQCRAVRQAHERKAIELQTIDESLGDGRAQKQLLLRRGLQLVAGVAADVPELV